jgi:hypothetical protein
VNAGTTMWPEDRDRIDSAIDAVARQMTDAAPGAALKARIMARIRATRPLWRSPWVISPATVAVIVVLAISLYHWRSSTPDTRYPDRVSGSRRANNADTAPSPREQSEERGSSQLVRPRYPGLSESSSDNSPLGNATRTQSSSSAQTVGMTDVVTSPDVDEPALPSLEVETIAVDRLARPEPLTLQHLEISPISLAPIGEGDHQ